MRLQRCMLFCDNDDMWFDVDRRSQAYYSILLSPVHDARRPITGDRRQLQRSHVHGAHHLHARFPGLVPDSQCVEASDQAVHEYHTQLLSMSLLVVWSQSLVRHPCPFCQHTTILVPSTSKTMHTTAAIRSYSLTCVWLIPGWEVRQLHVLSLGHVTRNLSLTYRTMKRLAFLSLTSFCLYQTM